MQTENKDQTSPIPINNSVLMSALRMKTNGLPWSPQVGCFVWDRESVIQAPSPFPKRVYFILSMPRFMKIFGSQEAMRKQLVWVPTWHQAYQLCRQLGVAASDTRQSTGSVGSNSEEDGLLGLYDRIARALEAKAATGATWNRLNGTSMADRWIRTVIEEELGSLAHFPRKVQNRIASAYREAGMVYLGWRRIQERQPADWVPPESTFDATLLDDLGHFYSDYQQVIKAMAAIRKKVGRLQAIDPSQNPENYQELVKELLELNDRSPKPGQIMADLMDQG